MKYNGNSVNSNMWSYHIWYWFTYLSSSARQGGVSYEV